MWWRFSRCCIRFFDWPWIFFSSWCKFSIFRLRPCILDIIASRAASVWSGVWSLHRETLAVAFSEGIIYSLSRSTIRWTDLKFFRASSWGSRRRGWSYEGEGSQYIIWTQTWWYWVGITKSRWFSAFSFVDVSSAAMIVVDSLGNRSLIDTWSRGWDINQQYVSYVPWTWVGGGSGTYMEDPAPRSRYLGLSHLANRLLDILHHNKTYE